MEPAEERLSLIATHIVVRLQARMTELKELYAALKAPEAVDERVIEQIRWLDDRLQEAALFLSPLNFARPSYGALGGHDPQAPFLRKVDEMAMLIASFEQLKPALRDDFCTSSLMALAWRAVGMLLCETELPEQRDPPHPDPEVRARADRESQEYFLSELPDEVFDERDAMHRVLRDHPNYTLKDLERVISGRAFAHLN